MEIVLGVLGFLATLFGLLLAWGSRTDHLLTQIRDVLIDIRDDLRGPSPKG
jgi:hypothetical protein